MSEHYRQQTPLNLHAVSLISSLLGIALGVYFVARMPKEDSRTPYNQPVLPSSQPSRPPREQPSQRHSQQNPLEQRTSSLYEQFRQFAEQKPSYQPK